MSPTHGYKKAESKVYDFIVRQFSRAGSAISDFFSRLVTRGKQRFTVMLIPHSEKKIFNFKISVFTMVFISVILSGVIIAFFVFSTRYSGLSRIIFTKSAELHQTRASLEQIRDEVTDLKKVSGAFETTLNKTLGILGMSNSKNGGENSPKGDLASFLNVEEQTSGTLKEVSDLKNLKDFMSKSEKSLQTVSGLLSSQGKLLADLPTKWPVGSGIGRITNYFGPEIHPFTGQWYLHKGIDIASYRRGVPILAAANGKVIERGYEAMGYGNYLVIRHAYGFTTKYGHMSRIFVNEGDTVTQGQRIGTMGNTGLSTGQHLHFEVRVGSQVVDPLRFLNVKSGIR